MPKANEVDRSTANFHCLVTGDYGTGKSVFAASFPTPGYVFDFDKGIQTYADSEGDWEYDHFDITGPGWTVFDAKYKEIKKRVVDGEFKTVVIDSTTTMGDMAMARALQLDPTRFHGGPQWNIHYGIAKNLMEPKLRGFTNFNCNLVVCCHLQIEKDQDSGAIIAVNPLLVGQLSERYPGNFDEVYFTKTVPKDQETRYVLQTVTRGLWKARSRKSGVLRYLPDLVPNNYNDLMEYLNNPVPMKERKKK